MAVADAGIADAQPLESQLINHAASGGPRRVFEDATCGFLTERLAGAPFLIADTNPLKNFLVRFGGKLQRHCEHHIISCKRSVTVFKGNLIAPEDFYPALGSSIQLDFADVAADLHTVGSGVHAQRTADAAGHADQAFHSAEVVLGAVSDG